MAEPKVAQDAEERGEGICRTCLHPIWNEGGTVGYRERETGWSDRVGHSGDSLVCFKAVEYRHVPLKGREAYIYDVALARGAAALSEQGEEWEYGARHSQGTNPHGSRKQAEEMVAWHASGDSRKRPEARGKCLLVRRRPAGPWLPVPTEEEPA